MYFCAFLGSREQEPAWRGMVQRHAAWLRLTAHLRSRDVADGKVLTFGWVSLSPPDWDALAQEAPDRVTIASLPTLSPPDDHLDGRRGFETNTAQLQVSLETGEVRATVPIGSLEEFCYARSEKGLAFSNDLRLLARWGRPQLDERGVYGLFTYHVIPPTLTLFRGIHRVPQGHMLTLSPNGGEPALRSFFRPPERLADEGLEGAAARLRETLDGILAQVPPSPVLLFSGGTDSGLLAARFAALGRKDVTLLNFAMHPSDPESLYALRMAAHLGLRCQQVVWDAEAALSRLQCFAEEVAFPMDDPATLPTMLLVMAAARRMPLPGAGLDGAGVGGLFTTTQEYRKWKRLYAVPAPMRKAAAAAFGRGLWKRDVKPTRLAARFCKSVQLPLIRGIACHSYTPHGIAYDVPGPLLDEWDALLETYQDAHGKGFVPEDSVNIIRTQRLAVAGTRTFEPLRRRGVQPIFPFVEPQMRCLCFALPLESRNDHGQAKGVLKRILAESVPGEWAYRPKRAFRPVFREAFAHPAMQAFIGDVVLARTNPLMELCRPRVVREMIRRAAEGKPLTVEIRRFLWTLVFASAWLGQLQAEL